MTNTATKAQREFDILEKTTKDAIIMPFKKEILALVEKFGNSGQSGGSAPYYAGAISSAVKKLCMQEPIGPITGENEEWNEAHSFGKRKTYQNNRCSAIFKEGKTGRAYYIDAIVFDGDDGGCFTGNGSVKLKDGTKLSSRQFIREFPFHPKTFYIDVIDHRFNKNKETGKLTPSIDGDWWEHTIKDEAQLEEVFEYYDKK